MSTPTNVFVFAHPDDEFGVFAEIGDAITRGISVKCLYLTDGGFGGRSVDRRAEESLAVLRELGVKDSDVRFVGRDVAIRDGELSTRLDPALAVLEEVLRRAAPIERIYVPAWEGGHQDHDAAHVLGVVAWARDGSRGEILQFPLYTGARRPGPFFRVLAPLPENGPIRSRPLGFGERTRSLRLCLSYPSQWKAWLGLFPFVLAHHLFRGTQDVQPIAIERLRTRPYDGVPLYERRGFKRWDDFAAETAPLREEAQRAIE